MMNPSNKIDLLALFLLLVAGIITSLYFDVKPLTSALLFFGFPSAYLQIRRPKNIHRVCAGTFLFGFLFGFGFDFMALINMAWDEPLNQLFFPNRILGVIALDHIIWFLLWNFPGQYIGKINIFGLEFPFEEFFFWTIMSSVSILSYYEIFVDDGR